MVAPVVPPIEMVDEAPALRPPETPRDPVTVALPDASVPAVLRLPAVSCPVTPRPPDTVKAPVAVVVLAVAFVIDVIPVEESVPVMVVLPDARVPVTVFPEVTCPEIPTPPDTTRAPVPVVVLEVAFVSVVIPVADNVPVMVVFPETRVPVVERLPAVICPTTPRPPETVKAPDPVVVLTVVAVILVFPDAESVPVIVVFPELMLVAVSTPVLVLPEVTCPTTPSPPAMVSAPVPVVVLTVVLESVVFPVAESVPVIVVFPEESVPEVLIFPAVT